MDNPVLSIVVPAHNEEKYIARCISSLLKQDFNMPYEIIAVNNNSTDSTIDILNQFSNQIRIIECKEKGVAIARNSGIKEARSEIIVSTDSDCFHPEDWLSQIYKSINANEEVLAVGGYAIYSEKSFYQKIAIFSHKMNLMKLARIIFGGQALSTQNLAFRKDSWRSVGGFDQNIKSTWQLDDVDFTLRLNELGEVRLDQNLLVYASARRVEENVLFYLKMRTKGYVHYMLKRKDIRNYYSEITSRLRF